MTRSRKTQILHEIKSLHQQLGRRPVKRDSSYLYHKTRKVFGTWNFAMKAAGYKVRTNQSITLPSQMTPVLCYFVGLVLTDGHLQESKGKFYRTLLFTSYNNECRLLCNLVRDLFSYNPLIRKKKYGWNVRPNYELHISSKELLDCLHVKFEIPIGHKSRTIRVPSVLRTSSNECISSFIRGVIDGDGDIQSKSKTVRISSGSKLFLHQLCELFRNIGVRPGGIALERAGIYRLHISGTDNLKSLYNMLYSKPDYYYPRRLVAWNALLKGERQITFPR